MKLVIKIALSVYIEAITRTPANSNCFRVTLVHQADKGVKGICSFVNTRSHSRYLLLLDNHTQRLLVSLLWLVFEFLLECRTLVLLVDWLFAIFSSCHHYVFHGVDP